MLAAVFLALLTAPANVAVPPILMYHRVDVRLPSDPVGRQLTVTPGELRAQLAYLRRAHLRTIDMAQLAHRISNGIASPDTVVLTFDDGYADQYRYAVPLLETYGSRATFYIVTGVVGDQRHLTWTQLRAMESLHMDIGAHGIHHADLSAMTAAQQAAQIEGSIHALRSHLGYTVASYAYPSGRFNRETLRLVREAGIELAATTDTAFVIPPAGPYELARLRVRGGWTIADFAHALAHAERTPQIVGIGYPHGGGQTLRGTIASIRANRMILQLLSGTTVQVDDALALRAGAARNLAVGEPAQAFGFWSGGVFYASRIDDLTPPGSL